MTLTKAQIIAEARNLIAQEESGNSDFEDSELLSYANNGLQEIAVLVEWPRTRTTQQVTAGTAEYSFPTGAFKLRTAYFGVASTAGDIGPLMITTEESLSEKFPGWLETTTASRGRPRHIFMKDRTTYTIYPTPSAEEAVAGKLIYLTYVKYPTALSADSDTPDIPDVFHPLIPEYVKFKAMMGKLKMEEKGMSLYNSILKRAKLLQPTVTEEIATMRLEFGNDDFAALNYDFQDVLP